MRHNPALDGLRGVAILLVVAFHLRLVPGGWVGVNVFFVLSGYLITSLLLAEHDRSGTIALPAFYRRRFTRLAPALLVALAIMLLLWTAANQQGVAYVRTLPALLYVANFALAVQPDWTITGWAWSLSLEEQFYALWPPILRRALRRGVTTARLVRVLLALSLVLMVLRAVFGGDYGLGYALFRGDELMLGAVVAFVPVVAPAWVTALSLVGLVVVAGTHSLDHVRVTVTVGTLAAVGLLTSRDRLAPVLSLRPLRYMGRISYALYLWDGVLVNAPLPMRGPHGASLPITAAAFVMAVLSTHLLEEPLRQALSQRRQQIRAPVLNAAID